MIRAYEENNPAPKNNKHKKPETPADKLAKAVRVSLKTKGVTKDSYDVYVGRYSKDPRVKRPVFGFDKYGNKNKVGSNHPIYGKLTQQQAVELYSAEIVMDPNTVKDIKKNLSGKRLACWCEESPCHADVLVDIANDTTGKYPINSCALDNDYCLESNSEDVGFGIKAVSTAIEQLEESGLPNPHVSYILSLELLLDEEKCSGWHNPTEQEFRKALEDSLLWHSDERTSGSRTMWYPNHSEYTVASDFIMHQENDGEMTESQVWGYSKKLLRRFVDWTESKGIRIGVHYDLKVSIIVPYGGVLQLSKLLADESVSEEDKQ
jgi:hypothetical protein